MKKLIIFLIVLIAVLSVFGGYLIIKGRNAVEIGKETNCALNLYEKAKQSGINFSSQCLGTCGDYAVDIVHVPRTSEDNVAENQCEDYRVGKVGHFIELDKEGKVVRIV